MLRPTHANDGVYVPPPPDVLGRQTGRWQVNRSRQDSACELAGSGSKVNQALQRVVTGVQARRRTRGFPVAASGHGVAAQKPHIRVDAYLTENGVAIVVCVLGYMTADEQQISV